MLLVFLCENCFDVRRLNSEPFSKPFKLLQAASKDFRLFSLCFRKYKTRKMTLLTFNKDKRKPINLRETVESTLQQARIFTGNWSREYKTSKISILQSRKENWQRHNLIIFQSFQKLKQQEHCLIKARRCFPFLSLPMLLVARRCIGGMLEWLVLAGGQIEKSE